MEIERFLPRNPGWHITGVDPSHDMLALTQTKAEPLGVAERVTLIRGTVEVLPIETRFDAATCLFVLHFLTDAAKWRCCTLSVVACIRVHPCLWRVAPASTPIMPFATTSSELGSNTGTGGYARRSHGSDYPGAPWPAGAGDGRTGLCAPAGGSWVRARRQHTERHVRWHWSLDRSVDAPVKPVGAADEIVLGQQ